MTGRVVHVKDRVPGAHYIGRANPSHGLEASPLANPFRIGRGLHRQEVITRYDRWLWNLITGTDTDPAHPDASFWAEQVIACRDKPLACWCRHDGEARTDANACHADVILGLLEVNTDDDLRALARGAKPERTIYVNDHAWEVGVGSIKAVRLWESEVDGEHGDFFHLARLPNGELRLSWTDMENHGGASLSARVTADDLRRLAAAAPTEEPT